MNVFFVLDGKAITPPLSGTILPGVTRDSALTLLAEMGTAAEERQISIDRSSLRARRRKTHRSLWRRNRPRSSRQSHASNTRRELQFSPSTASSVAAKLRSRLVAIQTGREPDTHNWLLSV